MKVLPLLIRVVCFFYALPRWNRFKRSRAFEACQEHLAPGERLWWAYKYFLRPVELPEPGRGIEALFEGQTLDFTPPPEFTPQASAVLSAGGDILPSRFITRERAGHIWDDVGDYFFDTDLAFANFESPLNVSKPFSPLPDEVTLSLSMNNDEDGFNRCYRDGKGFTLFSTANNHAMDMGVEGLAATLDYMEKRACLFTGTARSLAERDAFPVVERNGIRIAFLAYTFSLNNRKLPEGKEYLANYFRLNQPDCDLSLVKNMVRKAREEKHADLVVVCPHWGAEYESFPLKAVIDTGHRIADLGADIIVGNHPHVIQPAELYVSPGVNGGPDRKCLICYALGDLVSYTEIANSRLGYLAKIQVQKGVAGGREMALVSGLELKAYYLSLTGDGEFRVLDLNRLLRALDAGENRFGHTKKQTKEIRRLGDLADRVIPRRRV
jgi:poly-gamma-glutamate synthesis protein (capsule biosynthesis protein)